MSWFRHPVLATAAWIVGLETEGANQEVDDFSDADEEYDVDSVEERHSGLSHLSGSSAASEKRLSWSDQLPGGSLVEVLGSHEIVTADQHPPAQSAAVPELSDMPRSGRATPLPAASLRFPHPRTVRN